jgi:transposase-like protein
MTGRSIMARKRRSYTPEFKAEAVKFVTEQGYSVAEAACSLGIHDILLRSWKPRATRPSPATAGSLPSRRSCAACAPRTSGCGRSGTS